MTLSPVFRSAEAVRLLEQEGVWERLRPAIAAQAEAVRTIHRDLAEVIGSPFCRTGLPTGVGRVQDELRFLQEFFFLILFRALFESLGVPSERLPFYAELNFCIKGTITAADNLFDNQDKSLLPLDATGGARNLSILQLLCFERLSQRVFARAERDGTLTAAQRDAIQRGLLTQMAAIGQLEGSEESGVREIVPPAEMIERVHRVRGGALFALAFVAPKVIENGPLAERVLAAEPAIARLGTAFQIVDDLTDFEFDLSRRSHNLLASQICHHGSAREREEFAALWSDAATPLGTVESLFRESARCVLDLARTEARHSFEAMAALGFWFSPALSDQVVAAIVGLDGVARMESLLS